MRVQACWFAVPLLLISAGSAQAGRSPDDRTVSKDVTAYWKKTWPDQELAHVGKKSDCEETEVDGPVKRGKPTKLKACLIKTDVFVAKGFRYLIYRDTYVYYVGRKLHSVQLGELQKAWKAGGVPAPTQEQAVELLRPMAATKLGVPTVEINVVEMGIPRIHGEFFRVSLLVDAAFQKDGRKERRDKILATLQSDGGDWQVIPELAF